MPAGPHPAAFSKPLLRDAPRSRPPRCGPRRSSGRGQVRAPVEPRLLAGAPRPPRSVRRGAAAPGPEQPPSLCPAGTGGPGAEAVAPSGLRERAGASRGERPRGPAPAGGAAPGAAGSWGLRESAAGLLAAPPAVPGATKVGTVPPSCPSPAPLPPRRWQPSRAGTFTRAQPGPGQPRVCPAPTRSVPCCAGTAGVVWCWRDR